MGCREHAGEVAGEGKMVGSIHSAKALLEILGSLGFIVCARDFQTIL